MIGLFLTVFVGLIGGYVAKKLKISPIIGYIVAGILSGYFIPVGSLDVEKLSELGGILLLFSIGLEFSLDKFRTLIKKISVMAVFQILLCIAIFTVIIFSFNLGFWQSFILSIGFSMSSTAVVVKLLFEKGESETIHGKTMLGWLLVQDLAVFPVILLMNQIAIQQNVNITLLFLVFIKAIVILGVAILLGKSVVPYIIHKIAETNSRELILLTAVSLAIGTAILASLLGISPQLGAFVAGFVISESQENHAVFAETRPLKNLFVALFFVSLGFLVSPVFIINNLLKIVLLTILVIVVKIFVVGFVSYIFKNKGKTLVFSSLGLSQVGEFAIIIFSLAKGLNLITADQSSLGIAVALFSLIVTPFIYAKSLELWRYSAKYFEFLNSYEKNNQSETLTNHIVLLGFGRVGAWIGKALVDNSIDFIVVDYDRDVVGNCVKKGIKAIYGDPAEKEVLEMVNIKSAKVVIIAIPDRISQESVISHIQSVSPTTKIISRVHLDEDWDKIKTFNIEKLVQPEFEAAAAIIKNIFVAMGKNKEDINKSIKSVRLSHAKI